jgi:hypothetical protein
LRGRRRRVTAATGQGQCQDDEGAESASHEFLSVTAVRESDTSPLTGRSCRNQENRAASVAFGSSERSLDGIAAAMAGSADALGCNTFTDGVRHEFAGTTLCVLHLTLTAKSKNSLFNLIGHIWTRRLLKTCIPTSNA